MHISTIKIKNFRLLKDFSINLEKNLSIIIGKNNTGKTSFVLALEKFLKNGKIDFYDINTDFKNYLATLLKDMLLLKEENFNVIGELGIILEMVIEYDDKVDSLENLSKFITDLEPDNKKVFFKFKFLLNYDNYKNMHKKLQSVTENEKKESYIKKHLAENLIWKAYSYYEEERFENIHEIKPHDADLNKLLNIEIIRAPRDFVKNNSKTLSVQSSDYFRARSKNDSKVLDRFSEALEKIDKDLKTEYDVIYKDVFDSIKKYIDDDSINPEVIPELNAEKIIGDNTIVKYQNDLPEYNNGLGYLNLISILLEIHLYVEKLSGKASKPDIFLLFIEEPEAHTHPQMQYIFIKNIKELLKKQSFQSIISSHSSHIVSNSDFEDIKYFYFNHKLKTVDSKNISELMSKIGKDHFAFLKKYLTLNSAELFFANKAIFIEGDSERILLPSFIKKISAEPDFSNAIYQNISIIHVGGAYAHIFKPLMNFFDIKCLIITDIDYKLTAIKSKDATGKTKITGYKSNLSKGITNQTIKKLIRKNSSTAEDLIEKAGEEIQKNKIYIAFQKDGTRSFEDSFFEKNREFILDNKNGFKSLKKRSKIDTYKDKFGFSDNFISKKTDFATDILYHSNSDLTNWDIPDYISNGLKWLLKDDK